MLPRMTHGDDGGAAICGLAARKRGSKWQSGAGAWCGLAAGMGGVVLKKAQSSERQSHSQGVAAFRFRV